MYKDKLYKDISTQEKTIIYEKKFECYLAAPRPILAHYQGGSLMHPMLITVFLHTQTKGDWEPRNEVVSLRPVKHLVGFEAGTFWFWLQCLNPLVHSPLHFSLFMAYASFKMSVWAKALILHKSWPSNYKEESSRCQRDNWIYSERNW